jgi:transposase
MYAQAGHPSIASKKLLRALLLQAFHPIRSERQLMEQLDYNLLFHWFVGLAMDAPVWDPSTFSKNRDRLLEGDVARRLLAAIVEQPRGRALMSDDHVSVDGTLIQAWTSHKSFRPKPPEASDEDGDEQPGAGSPPVEVSANTGHPSGRNRERDWRGQTRGNETHASVTDPDARLAPGPMVSPGSSPMRDMF